MIFFAKKNKSREKKKLKIEPIKLYSLIAKSKEYICLRGIQEEVLKDWHIRRDEKKLSQEHSITAVKQWKNLRTEFNLPLDFGDFDYACCTTSHGAQGKTVDHVFINKPSVAFMASNLKQFDVSTSQVGNGLQFIQTTKKLV